MSPEDTLSSLWWAHRDGMPTGEFATLAATAQQTFYVSMIAFVRGEFGEAVRHAEAASSAAPSNLVYREAVRYLVEVAGRGRRDVYGAPKGFAAFIRGGGNVELYRATSAALRDRYRRHRPGTLLDIGAGDGLALLPALTDDIGIVDVLEPSPAMLETAAAALRDRAVAHRAFRGTTHDLVAGAGPWPGDTRWSLVQSTFTLHVLHPDDRAEALAWIRRRADRLLVAEFDVPPPGATCEPEWFAHVVSRYEHGLAEYDGDGGLVAQGFLMPIMFGYFDPAQDHHEQPMAAWVDDLTAAGFTEIAESQPLCDYWWAPAYLLEAAG